MKFVHLSDLHLGKRVHELSMLEDQKYILDQCLEMIREEAPDGVLIAGDIYDKAVPPAEAVSLFDRFLTALSGMNLQVFLIAGNHDSPERIAFGARLFSAAGIHVSPVFSGVPVPVSLERDGAAADIWLLPYIRPAQVRQFLETEAEDYTQALEAVISRMEIRQDRANILVCHQFVTGGTRSESETFQVGGTDNVDLSVFAPFDYVALGHLHGPQRVGRDTVRYCGTPLKYSFSEKDQHKSMTVVEVAGPGQVTVRTRPFRPLHDMRELRGRYTELMHRDFYSGQVTEDYLRIILTDEEELPDAVSRLRLVYPNLLRLDYDNLRTRTVSELHPEAAKRRTPLELFEELYEKQNGQGMSPEQLAYLQKVISELEERHETA